MSELTPEERAREYARDFARHLRGPSETDYLAGYRAAESDCERHIAAAVAQERERAARMVDHILREGGGTYGDAIRAEPMPSLAPPSADPPVLREVDRRYPGRAGKVST